MSKAILEFDLSDVDDKLAYKQADNALNALGTLFDIRTNINRFFKHKDLTNEQYEILEQVDNIISTAFEDHNINLDELYN